MELKRKFKVVLHKEAHEFLANLDEKTRKKIIQTFDRASLLLDAEVFEKLANTDIWEFRTLFNKKKYRVLAFWDKTTAIDTLVIATHGFIKKLKRPLKKKLTGHWLLGNNISKTRKTTGKMNKDFITLEESKDELIGKIGTPERDAYEEELRLYAIGAAIRETRKSQNLTQEELGRMVGVQKAQISRIENGKNLTFATVLKLFKAMNVSVKLDIDKLGRVALC